MTLISPSMTNGRARAVPSDLAPEGALSDGDFARIAAFAHREFGLHLPQSKKQHVQSRLIRLLSQTGCPDFKTLCDRLEAQPNAPERNPLISALTTNVTQFFREEHHFRLFAEEVLRPQLPALRAGKRLRIWSAGCSAGQEALTIAMTILDILPEAADLNIRILGTDIDPAILEDARRGEYTYEDISGIPEKMRRSMVEQTASKRCRITPRASKMISYGELNLIGTWPMRGPFDAIFCRNVAIYFDKPTQAMLWNRFTDLLSPGGILMIGHSERVSGPAADRLTSAGVTSYRLAGPSSSPERTRR